MASSDPSGLRGRRLLLGAKEAGAATLLAALATDWQPAPGSICLTTEAGAPFFAGGPLARHVEIVPRDGLEPEWLRERLKHVAPAAIAVGASAGRSIEKQLMRAGEAAGIPVHAFVDHYWNLWQRFADEDTARRWAYLPDRIYVPAMACRDRILAQGCPATRVEVFRHPLLDRRTAPAAMDRARAREALAIPQDAVVAMFVSEYRFGTSQLWQWEEPAQADIEGLLRILLAGAEQSRLDGTVKPLVLIKMHPAESHEWEWVRAPFSADLAQVVHGFDKGSLFAAVDSAFGLNSMLLLEVANAGLPAYSFHSTAGPTGTRLSSIRPEIVELSTVEACWQAMRVPREQSPL